MSSQDPISFPSPVNGSSNASPTSGQIRRPLDPIVADASPKIYAAAGKINLTESEVTQIEQWSALLKKHKELMAMDNAEASSAFQSLDPAWQEGLKSFFQTDYATKPPTNPFLKTFVGGDGLGIDDVIRSPFRGIMWLGDQYYKLVNTVGNTAQLMAQAGGGLNRATIDRARDGIADYNEEKANKLIEKYGGQRSFIAMKLLNGDTPGEIMEAWGPNDPEMLVAINEMLNDSGSVAQTEMMNDFRRAQLSPGRTVANFILSNLGVDVQKHNTVFNIASGVVDGLYQILADPMTYMTFGTSAGVKGLTKAGRLAKLIGGGDAVKTEAGIIKYFENTKVREIWDQYGSHLENYSKAFKSGDDVAAAKEMLAIRNNFPELAVDDVVKALADGKVFNADAAKDFFLSGKRANLLMRGRTLDLRYSREGAIYSRRLRNMTIGAKRMVRDFVTGGEDWSHINKESADAVMNEMIRVGSDISGTTRLDMDKFSVQYNGNKVQQFFKKMTAHSPAGKLTYISDSNTSRHLEVVREQALLAIGNSEMAEVITLRFLRATAAERVAIQRALDVANLQRIGVDKVHGGMQFMKTLLDSKYGSGGGMAATRTVEQPNYLRKFDELGNDITDEVVVTGPLHGFQVKDAIAPLPWREIGEFMAGKFKEGSSKVDLVTQTIGGAYNNKVINTLTDIWSTLTLVPRLGIRSVMDEGFFAALYMNTGLAREISSARRAGKALTAASGSDAAVGPVRNAIEGILTKALGRPVGALRFLSKQEREQILKSHLESASTPEQALEAYRDAKREIFDISVLRFGKNKIGPDEREELWQLFEHHPRALIDDVQSFVSRALTGQSVFKVERIPMASETALEQSFIDAGIHRAGEQQLLESLEFSKLQEDLARFQNMSIRLAGSRYELVNKSVLDLGRIFLDSGALADIHSYRDAMNMAMQTFGMNSVNGKYLFAGAGAKKMAMESMRDFLGASTQNIALDVSKLSEQQVIEETQNFLKIIFFDLNRSFNELAPNGNGKLLNWLSYARNAEGKVILDKAGLPKKDYMFTHFRDNLQHLGSDIDTYIDLTKDFRNTEGLFTDLKLGVPSTEPTEWIKKFQDRAFEEMDKQINGLFRQPAVLAHYFGYRKQYKGAEKLYANSLYKDMVKERRDAGQVLDELSLANIKKRAVNTASRAYTEQAITDATHSVLKFSDNAANRTVFAYEVRSVGRFYRAIEDFHRRMARLVVDHPLDAIYRMRLMTTGLRSFGAAHKDSDNHSYIIMPMDDVLFAATDNTLRMLTNNRVGVSQPLFNDFTMKLSAGNPSFQDDAGMPYLSGPMGSLSVMGVKAALGIVPGGDTAAEKVDNMLLGKMGDNPTFETLIPVNVRNVFKMFNYDEKDEQLVSAAQQAIAYGVANGTIKTQKDFLNADGVLDEAAWNRYVIETKESVRISAHNILVLRGVLNMFSPISVQMRDTKDLPDYLKDTGLTSMSNSFYDVLDKIEKLYPDAEDPYELALATWQGENPAKLAYVVSTKDKGVGVVLNYTQEAQDWITANKYAIDNYGLAAVSLAPKVGEFSNGVYTWAKAAGFIKSRDLEDYMLDVMSQSDENAYYDLKDQEEAALQATANPNERKMIILRYQNLRELALAANPRLEQQINSPDKVGKYDFVTNIYGASQDPNVDVPEEVRVLISQAYYLFKNFKEYADNIGNVNPDNATDLKRQKKEQLIAQLMDLADSDPTGIVNNFYNSGLRGLINGIINDAPSTIYLRGLK